VKKLCILAIVGSMFSVFASADEEESRSASAGLIAGARLTFGAEDLAMLVKEISIGEECSDECKGDGQSCNEVENCSSEDGGDCDGEQIEYGDFSTCGGGAGHETEDSCAADECIDGQLEVCISVWICEITGDESGECGPAANALETHRLSTDNCVIETTAH
jgi:hypothetical protein